MRKFLSLSCLLMFALTVILTAGLPASAAPVSTVTAPVKGHGPTVSGVGITGPATPLAGDTLHLGATFSDPDGDTESGSLLQWYHSDGTAIAGATGQDYVIQDSDAGQRLQAGCTPKTDPLITDPDTGAEVKSALTVLIMGKPDGAKSTFTRDKGTISATGADKAILTLTLKDSSGNPVSGIAGRLSLAHVPVAGADSVSLRTDDRGNGVYDFSVTGTQPGTVEFTPQLDGAPLATTPATLSLLLTGDSATAQITASDLTVTRNDAAADDSATNQVQAVVTDASGRPVSGVAVSFTTVAPAHITVSTGVTDVNGVATASLASTQAGPVTVTARINSTGSEQSVDVNFTAGAPFTATSTLTAVPGTIVANGGGTSAGRSVLTLALKDKNNNPVTGRADIAFVVSGVADTALTAVTESPAGSGVYTATLNGTTAGLASVSPTVGGTAFSATPSVVNVTLVADPSTAAVSAFTSTTTPALANNADTQTLTATVKDAKGNVVPGATVNFTVTTGIATLGSATATTNASGVATVTVKDTTAETATITAKVGANAADTGKTADATFGLYPVVSGISNASPAVNNSPADGVTQNTLVVQVSDLAGNAVTNTAVTLSLTGTDLKTGPATLKYGATVLTAVSTPSVTTDANGRVILTATDVTAETITVSAKTSTSTQAAQTATSTFVVYPVLTPANLTITSDTAPADGVTTNAAQAKVTDLKGNPLSGQTVTFTVTSPSGQATGASTLTPVTDASGIATLTLTDRTMETATVKATVGTAVPASQVQTVTPVFKLFANLTMTVSNNNCAVNCTVSFAVTALDANDAPVSGLVVNTFDGGGTGSAGTAGTTNASGQVTLTRSYTAATTNNMTYAYANIAQNSAMSTRRTEYSTAHVAINTVVSITGISVNGATFATNVGFPTTGFTGAKFQLLMNGVTTWNGDYNWSTSQTGWTSVDAAGNVSFAGTPSSATKSVTITATPKSGVGPARTYSFTLSYWLLNQGSRGAMTALDSTCSGLGYASVPLNIITDRTSASPTGAARKVGYLWNEWGAMATYGWNTAWAHWSANWVTLNTDRVTVWLLNGNWQSENRTGATYYNWNLCYKGL